MLKWLVTRPSSSATLREVVTDDPLATLKVNSKVNQVYAVSRVNPLYEDEESVHSGAAGEGEEGCGAPGAGGDAGPPGDRTSLRSSGYGSKETDSASDASDGHEEEDTVDGSATSGAAVLRAGGRPVAALVARDPAYVRAIEVGLRRARSLEGLGPARRPPPSGASTVPRPVWPRGSPPPRASNPLDLDLDLVRRDPRFVTSIQVSGAPGLGRSLSLTGPPAYPAPAPPRSTTLTRGLQRVSASAPGGGLARYFGVAGEVLQVPAVGPDSLVTEETLRLMGRHGEEPLYEAPRPLCERRSAPPLPVFRRATIPRGLSASLSRAPPRTGHSWLAPPPKARSRSVEGAGRGPRGGVWAIMDLWERSGLKTNGRKLLVNLENLGREGGGRGAERQDSNASCNTYEDVGGPCSRPPSPGGGVDNPAFVGDAGGACHQLDPAKLAHFQRAVSARLQGAPPHRTMWLHLDHTEVEAEVGAGAGRAGRRVTFTADTRSSPATAHHPPLPGKATRQPGATEGEDSPAATTTTSSSSSSNNSSSSQQHGIWATTTSYHDRFRESPAGEPGAGQGLWERYYGTCGSRDTTLSRHLAPHPNSGAPNCESGRCHDFTLDLRRSDKLRRLTAARRRRRRVCRVAMAVAAVMVFLATVVAVSLYYTRGRKFFGPV